MSTSDTQHAQEVQVISLCKIRSLQLLVLMHVQPSFIEKTINTIIDLIPGEQGFIKI